MEHLEVRNAGHNERQRDGRVVVGRDGVVVKQIRYLDPIFAGLPCHQPKVVIELAGGETIPL